MEEKQKAKELIKRFYRYAKGQTNEARLINAKFSAIECMDETLQACNKFLDEEGATFGLLEYYENVKTEIENYENI